MSGLSTYAVLCNGVITTKLALDRAILDLEIIRFRLGTGSAATKAHIHYWEACCETHLNAIDQLCYAAIVHTVLHPRNFRRQWEPTVRGIREALSVYFTEECPNHNYEWIIAILADWKLQDEEAAAAAEAEKARQNQEPFQGT